MRSVANGRQRPHQFSPHHPTRRVPAARRSPDRDIREEGHRPLNYPIIALCGEQSILHTTGLNEMANAGGEEDPGAVWCVRPPRRRLSTRFVIFSSGPCREFDKRMAIDERVNRDGGLKRTPQAVRVVEIFVRLTPSERLRSNGRSPRKPEGGGARPQGNGQRARKRFAQLDDQATKTAQSGNRFSSNKSLSDEIRQYELVSAALKQQVASCVPTRLQKRAGDLFTELPSVEQRSSP